MKRRLAVIPAFEPDEALIKITEELSESGIEVVIVNDGSSEKYNGIFREAAEHATVLSYKKNHGKGYALKFAFRHIMKHYPNPLTIVTADADGQHSRKDIERVLIKAALRPDALVIGSRVLDKTAPFRSRFGNEVTRLVFRLCTRRKVHDTQSGLRAFDSSMLPFMTGIDGDRYEYEMNVLLAYAQNNYKITEIPIETIYRPGNSSSHFNPLRDSYLIYKEIILFTASSLLSFLIDFALYSLFCVLFSGLPSAVGISTANISARVISSTVNFNINRKLVFKSNSSLADSAVRYFVLAAGIMIANTFLLNALVDFFLVNRIAAKLICEIVFFLVSWFMQHFVIFPKEAGHSKTEVVS